MKILLTISSDTPLQCYEAMALALTLATFDHKVQLWLSNTTFDILLDPTSRFTGMIKSLTLYDIAPAWLDESHHKNLFNMLDKTVSSQLQIAPKQIDLTQFDEVLAL